MKNNNYDFIISELVYRTDSGSLFSGPYLEVSSDLLFNNQAPFTLNGSVSFTSILKNIPSGYTVKANTHTISYPIVVPDSIGSVSTLIGTPVNVVFSTIGDTFTVLASITLEHTTDPDIVITKSFTITAVGAIYFGSKATNNNFTLVGLSSTAYVEENQKVLLPVSSNHYIYFAFPTGSILPLFIRDRNGLVLDLSDFTQTTILGYNYLVLNWSTSITNYTTWELVYKL